MNVLRAMGTGLLLVAALPLAAQSDGAGPQPVRQGFWIGFGLGAGSNLSRGLAGTRGGGAGYLRMGGTVNQHLMIGGEGMSWARSSGGSTLTQGNTVAAVYFYPSATGGLYLKSGVGFAHRITSTSAGSVTVTDSHAGFGATFGGGIDIQVGRNVFITPNLDFQFQSIEGATGGLAYLTVGVTWH